MANEFNPENYVREQVLIDRLNIPVKKMRALRPAGVEVTVDGVWWPKAEAEALAQPLGEDVASQKTPAPKVEELVVVSTPRLNGFHYPNPRVIRARRKNGEEVFVQVISSRNYAPMHKATHNGPQERPFIIKASPPNGGVNWTIAQPEPKNLF